jgi:hypothetical protein
MRPLSIPRLLEQAAERGVMLWLHRQAKSFCEGDVVDAEAAPFEDVPE